MSPRFVPASITELQRAGLLAELPGETLVRLGQKSMADSVGDKKSGSTLDTAMIDFCHVLLNSNEFVYRN